MSEAQAMWNGEPSISIALHEEQIWRAFGTHSTEMIVTKPGRRLFPKLTLNIKGLEPQVNYGIRLVIKRVDNFKYRFQGGHWRKNGEEEEGEGKSGNVVYHIDGFMQRGRDWMKKPVDFNHFKMTTNEECEEKHMVFVRSLHRYTPLIEITDEHANIIQWQSLDVASFITVTSYQNSAITRLKVQYNPYAKGHDNRAEPPAAQTGSSRKRPSSTPTPVLQAPPTPTPPMQTSSLQVAPPYPSPPAHNPTIDSFAIHPTLSPSYSNSFQQTPSPPVYPQLQYNPAMNQYVPDFMAMPYNRFALAPPVDMHPVFDFTNCPYMPMQCFDPYSNNMPM